MKPFTAAVFAATLLLAPLAANQAAAQTPSAVEKLNAYVGCINRLSARSYDSRARYFSWAGKSGPTGKERIIYGTYTIYDTSDCKKNVEKANALEPRDAALEAAATAYAEAVSQARAAAQGGRRLLYPAGLQGRQDGQGPRPTSPSRGGVGCVRERRPEAAQRRRRHQRQTRAGETRRHRAKRRPPGALPCRSPDDPGQARAARGGLRQTRPCRDHAGAERLREPPSRAPNNFPAPAATARSAQCSSATPSRFWSRRRP